jgi:hypothetical protein
MLPPRVFGCVAYVHLHKNQRSKLDPYALRCLFLGYAVHQKGYRCYDPSTRGMYVTMDVTFVESEPFFPAPNSALQGETRDEEQNWVHFDWSTVPDTGTSEAPQSEIGEPIGSDEHTEQPTEQHASSEHDTPLEVETSPPHSTIPVVPSPENIAEVSNLDTQYDISKLNTPAGYTLPFKENHGKPPKRYSLEDEERRSKYPSSTMCLPEDYLNPLEHLCTYFPRLKFQLEFRKLCLIQNGLRQ